MCISRESVERKIVSQHIKNLLHTCPICGKKFYTESHQSDVRCPECRKKILDDKSIWKRIKISNEDFDKVLKKYNPYLTRLCFGNITCPYDAQFKGIVYCQALIILWRFCLSITEKYGPTEMFNLNFMLIKRIYGISKSQCIKCHDLPTNITGTSKYEKLLEDIIFIRLDKIVTSDEGRDEDTLMDTIQDTKPIPGSDLDCKNLVNTILNHSVTDEDVASCIISNELKSKNIGCKLRVEEKEKIIKEDYGMDLTLNEFNRKSRIGWQKLYSAYGLQIKEVLNISDQELTYSPTIKLDKDKTKTKTKICPVCGKEFTYERKDEIYCSAECKAKVSSNAYMIRQKDLNINTALTELLKNADKEQTKLINNILKWQESKRTLENKFKTNLLPA